jgi:hypothetical protein
VKYKIEETKDFKELVENLRGDLAEHILKSIDFDELFDFVIQMIQHIMKTRTGYIIEDRLIIERSLSLMFIICQHSKEKL